MPRIFATTSPNKSERELRNEQCARAIAAQGMVLLKNDGVLPLKTGGKIALYGNGARKTIKGGTGSGDVVSRSIVSVEQGLEDAGFTVATKGWMDKYDADTRVREAEVQKKLLEAKDKSLPAVFEQLLPLVFQAPAVLPIQEEDIVPGCDAAVYVIARKSGEGLDRKMEPGDYLLAEAEQEDLRKLTAAYDKVVVALNVGGVIDTKFLRELPGIGAIVLMSQGGCMGGHALADVLTGKVTPSGRLTTTWAENYEDYPCSDTFAARNGDTDDEYYTEGVYVGYRYFDTFGVKPAYPFGFGLSYTTFQVETRGVALEDGTVTVTARVTNTGKEYSGKEVVQVYCSAPVGVLEKPYQELAAYAKTKELAPGESQVLTLSFPVTDMASYSEEKAAYVLEPGTYYVRVGTHSRATHVAAALRLEREMVTEKLSNRFHLDCTLEELSAEGAVPYTYEGEDKEKANAPVIVIPADTIPCKQAAYCGENLPLPKAETQDKITLNDVREGRHTLDELVSQLTVEELIRLCVGVGWNTSDHTYEDAVICPGSVGGTAVLEDRGIRNMVLSDGPAGLRLTMAFYTDAQGNMPSISAMSFPGLEFLAGPKPEPPADAIHHYQYVTAIPIATLLAQTWDTGLLEKAGGIVGEEMAELGVDLWLAPGMNIHRNPLCGRNFEYFSEDPLVTGLCAAAETQGVQKLGRGGVTIKHFALNNQEDNRNYVNSHVRERAIREIYLKGFEIAVKRTQPMAIMTSYNLLNGIHTANDYDLITAAARDEWGFQGLVMTDWGTTGADKKQHKYGSSNAAGCIKAGNDLVMPGSQADKDEILRSVGAEDVPCPITPGDLQVCAKRVLAALLCCSAEH